MRSVSDQRVSTFSGIGNLCSVYSLAVPLASTAAAISFCSTGIDFPRPLTNFSTPLGARNVSKDTKTTENFAIYSSQDTSSPGGYNIIVTYRSPPHVLGNKWLRGLRERIEE